MRLLASFGLTLVLALTAAPALAAVPVTTGETDSGEPNYFVVIVDPLDGAKIPGSPDAVVPVVIEFEALDDGFDVHLTVDDGEPASCDGQVSPCTLEVTLGPGPHTLRVSNHVDEHTITVTVEDQGAATDTDATDTDATDTLDPTGSPTTGDSGETDASSETAGPQPGTDTTGANSDGADSAGGGGGEKGCACSTGRGAPDLFGLAVLALFAPWRRRRHA